MKKMWIMMLVLVCSTTIVFADDMEDEYDEGQIQDIIEVTGEAVKVPSLNARAAVVYDRTSKTVIFGKNKDTKRAMASTTKIMTALVVLEKANLTDTVEVSKKAAGTGGSRLELKAGDKVTVEDLLYGLMLRSGNDAAVALAEKVGGSVEGFAAFMNQKASQLGLIQTHFVTPHGLDNIEHYTTATELAKLTDIALENQKFAQIVGTKTITISINGVPREIGNTNELLGNLNGVYGVKTGFTNNAGRCLVTSTKRGEMDLICVVLGTDTKSFRTKDSVKLIEYGFENYQLVDIKEKIESEFNDWKQTQYKNIEVIKGIKQVEELELDTIQMQKYAVNKEEIKDIRVEITVQDTLQAPVERQKEIGTLRVFIKDNQIYELPVLTKEEIPKKDTIFYFKELLFHFGEYIEKNIQPIKIGG